MTGDSLSTRVNLGNGDDVGLVIMAGLLAVLAISFAADIFFDRD